VFGAEFYTLARMKLASALRRSALAAALASLAAACAPPVEPQIASSAGESAYAAEYPTALQAATEDLNNDEKKSQDLSGKFGGYPDALKSPPWAKVADIYDAADAEGRSYEYIEARREVDDAYFFFDSEKDEILKKVAGSAAYAAKQGHCDVDVSGAVSHALKEVVDKRLEKRLRDRSEANTLVERQSGALGKDNVDKLHDQADAIALASYLSHVKFVEDKLRLRRMLADSEAVKKTLDDAIRAEQAYGAESGRAPADKKASDERAEAMRKAAASIDSAVQQARTVEARLEERQLAVAKTYDDAMTKLREDVKKRAGK
jgi:hypothetical protein